MEKERQCTICGRFYLSKSSICCKCWLRLYDEKLVQVSRLIIEKRDLELKVVRLRKLCEQLLDQIMDNNMYTGELEQAIHSVLSRNWKEVQDEKNRVHGSKNRKDEQKAS